MYTFGRKIKDLIIFRELTAAALERIVTGYGECPKEFFEPYLELQNVDNVVTFVFKRGPLVWKDGVNVAPGLDVAGECCRSGKVTFAFVPSIAIESPRYCICLLHSNFETFDFHEREADLGRFDRQGLHQPTRTGAH